MNSYWRYIGGVVGVLILIGMLLPSRVVVERNIEIDAFPATVYALVNDFRQINRWSGLA